MSAPHSASPRDLAATSATPSSGPSTSGAAPTPEPALRRRRSRRRRRLPVALVALTALCAVVGATLLSYSDAASWFSAQNQAAIVDNYQEQVRGANPSAAEQLELAREYNALLASGAVLEENAHVATGTGSGEDIALDYFDLLSTPNGIMSRIQIPSIAVDLPIYHGTSDETLLRGAGHLKGTSLPVGGTDTHAVITAHRGLASARMFTDLDQLQQGDIFTISTFGEVLTYQVVDTRVIDPDDTATLRQEAGRDLVTLITCTPLGINTHRILVTGERITPTPPDQLKAADAPSENPGFPWWLVLYVGALVLVACYVWWATRRVTPVARRRRAPRDPSSADI